jgi:hypothetical protein
MKRRFDSPIDKSSLRDHAEQARVDRVWDRLEGRLAPVDRAGARARSGMNPWWLAAAVLAGFAGGVVATSWRKPMVTAAAEADRGRASQEPQARVLAAGAARQRYALPGGGAIELEPGSIVDTESESDRGLVLRLVRGDAVVTTLADASSAGRTSPLTVKVGDAEIALQRGRLSLKRRGDRADVRILEGAAELSGPEENGIVRLATGEQKSIAIVVRTVSNDAVDPKSTPQSQPRNGVRRDKQSDAAPSAPAWVTACASFEYGKAFELLQKEADVSAQLRQATNEQRLCIATGSRAKNNANLAIEALEKVANDSNDPQRAALAAADLARIYGEQGNVAKQREYENLKEIRSKGALLSESALCEKIKIEAQTGRHRTVLELARQYSSQYPSGSCSQTVEKLEAEARAKLAESARESETDSYDGE